jgi:uncharacterized protein YdhG (YjbR/CyaY superfamily)
LKAYGAGKFYKLYYLSYIIIILNFLKGLLSAFGELIHALSNKPEHKPFDPEVTAVQEYQDEDYQSVYFVAESFESAKQKLREYSKKIQKPYKLKYDPYTQSIKIMNDHEIVQEITKQLQTNLNSMMETLEILNVK